jgi:hypothetical protein
MQSATYTILIGGTLPLPASLVEAIQRIEIETSTEMASVFRIRFGITQTEFGDWNILFEDIFKPLLPLQIRIQTGLLPPQAIMNGFVINQEVVYDDQPSSSYLEITAMDITAVMNLQEKVVSWPSQLADSEIAAVIFGKYLVQPKCIPTLPAQFEAEGTITQRGTDIRFLRRLAERNSYECFIYAEPLSGIDLGWFGPAFSPPGLPQAVINVKMRLETNVSGFKIRYEMLRPTGTAGMGIDSATLAQQTFPALAALTPLGAPMGLEPVLQRIAPRPLTLAVETGQMRLPALASAVQGITDRSSWAVVAEGTVGPDVGILRPGLIINIRGAGRLYNGSYYVTSVHHTIDYGCYEQKFCARRNAVTMTGTELYAAG